MRSRDVAQAPNFSLGLLGFIVTQCVTRAPRNPQEGSQLNHPLSGTGDMGTSRPTEANLMLAPHIPPRAVDTCHVPLSPSPWLSNNIYSSSGNLAGATALFREAVTPLSPPQLHAFPEWAPHPQTVRLSLISQQVPLSPAQPGFVPHTPYLPPNAPAAEHGGGQDLLCCHNPSGDLLFPKPPRDPNCSGLGRKEEDLDQGPLSQQKIPPISLQLQTPQ